MAIHVHLCGLIMGMVLYISLKEISTQVTYFHEGQCSVSNRFTSCPSGYCCVYDEFFKNIKYCKRHGTLNSSCSTVVSDQDCPCQQGLQCKPSVSGHDFISIYGHCVEKHP